MCILCFYEDGETKFNVLITFVYFLSFFLYLPFLTALPFFLQSSQFINGSGLMSFFRFSFFNEQKKNVLGKFRTKHSRSTTVALVQIGVATYPQYFKRK